MKRKYKQENIDYNKLNKMREEGKATQEANPNPFLLQIPHTDKGLYKALYKFNTKAELEEYSLPLGKESQAKVSMQKTLEKQQSIIKQESQIQYYNEEEILEDNEQEESQEVIKKDVNYRSMVQNLFGGDKNKKQGNKIQNALFVNSAVQQVLNQIQTGEQAISFFAKYGNTTPIKFIYCTLDSDSHCFRPYDLKVLHKGENQKEFTLDDYYTISVHGIVHVYLDRARKNHEVDASTEVVSLSEWMHESTMFNIITNIHFFKHYVKTKLFKIWVANVRKRVFNQKRTMLVRNYFLVKPTFSKHIMDMNKLMYDLSQTKTISSKIYEKNKNWEIEDFKLDQKKQRQEAQTEYNQIIDKLNHQVNVVCKEVVERTYVKENEEEENKFSSQQYKQKPMNQIRREKENRAYRLRLAEKDKERLDCFIRMVDYLTVENLVANTLNSMQSLLDEMKREGTRGGGGGIFCVNVTFKSEPDSIVFGPDEKEIIGSILGIMKDIVKVVRDTTRVLGYNEFDQYLKSSSAQNSMPEIEHILLNSLQYQSIVMGIDEKINSDYDNAQKYVDNFYEKCRPIYVDENNYKESEWVNQDHQLEFLKGLLVQVKQWTQDLNNNIKDTTKGIVNVEGRRIRTTLLAHMNLRQENLKSYLANLMRSRADKTIESLKDYLDNVSKQPAVLNEFARFIEQLAEAQLKLPELEHAKNEIESMHLMLKKTDKSTLLNTDYINFERIQNDFSLLQVKVKEAVDYKADQRNSMIVLLDKGTQNLQNEISNTQGLLSTGKLVLDDMNQENIQVLDNVVKELPVVRTQLKDINKAIEKYKLKDKEYVHCQKLLEVNTTKNRELFELESKYGDRKLLWTNVEKFSKNNESWLNNNFQDLNTEEIERDMKQFESSNVLLNVRLTNADGSKDRVLQTLITNVNRITNQMPVMLALGNQDIKPRHLKVIFENLGMQPGKKFNFNELIANGVLDKREQMEEISARATGEAQIEAQVEAIKAKWAELNFIILPYKEYKDKYTMGTVEDILQALDDHQVSVQTMLGTRFVSEIRSTVEEWEKKLVLISEILDEWLTCQRQWIYLENIFNADDIQKQLPQETNRFFQVDKFWKEIMQKTFKHPLALDCCASEELLKKFIRNNQVLDEIQKSLENYLETKRRAFSRFYFLSNDEIIAIISQTGNPSAVQQHLRKCFDNINRIAFGEGEDSKEIVSMISADPEAQPEKVQFARIVQILPEDKPETWLTKIENMMLESLFVKMKQCLMEYPKTLAGQIERGNWVLGDYPAQCILTVDQIEWTTIIQDALIKEEQGQVGQVKEALNILLKQLNKMVDVIRRDLNTLQRSLIGALAVLDVHNRDVTISMVKKGVNQVKDFEWSKQLKYYWENHSERTDVVIRQTNTRFEYGYEYLGCSARLVITQLTDRCYMTLTGALSLYFGGAPQGPAGTGKTETTKDLAKGLAVNCVVFNCSGNMDYKTMGRFFSGLAQCGAWSCFDEFNRIEIDVLSVIAQQILTIQLAIRGKETSVEFEGRTIPLSNKFGVFITMNPGYAGRTELPDNLEALFRPVSMMIPEYRLIAEIILFAEGFETSSMLANKMVQLYQLSSQQLSKQTHYDFGMRAVKSVLVMAGQLRRDNPELSENIVLIRAMRDSNIPKFLSQDLPLFMGIIQDLFPGIDIPVNQYPELEGAIINQLKIHNLQVVPNFMGKIFELFETMNVRHGVMLVGQTGTGKTKCYETLQQAFRQLNDEGKVHSFYKQITQYKLNPKSVTMNQLFGYVNVMTNEWSDGIVAKTVREAVEDQTDSRKWVIFDGPVDALWIENMNTVLDDNKMLCLSNGQRIKLSNAFTMLFEVNDLAVASPATVSRCGMVYLDENALGWEPLLESWSKLFQEKYIDKETETVPPHIPPLVAKIKTFFKENFAFIRKECSEVIASQDINLVQSCINILEVLYTDYREAYPSAHSLSATETENLMSMIFVFSFIWSAGANLHDNPRNNSRVKFSQHFKSKILKLLGGFPFEGEIYDYFIDFQKREFKSWNELVPDWQFDTEQAYFNILVPTSDTVKFKYIVDKLITGGNQVLFNGETGTGKSVIMSDYLFQQQAANKFITTSLNFSAQTQSSNILDIFMDKDKFQKRKKTLLGPAQAGKKMVFFCDDINMPTPEQYFAQPPIELLRQIIDHGGFYDLQKLSFMYVKDVIFVGACGPPDGGRNHVTPRLFRHFNMIWIPEMPQRSLEVIFGAILKGFLINNPTKGMDKYASQIVRSSIEIYNKVTLECLPTPSKSHYTFNLRDLSKIFQGILQIPYTCLPDKECLLQLWAHENQRIFYDRLVDNNDRTWFLTQLQGQLKDNLDYEMSVPDIGSLLFGDYTNSYKEYQKIDEAEQLDKKFNDYLQIFNSQSPKNMNLVFFRDAINHLSRIIRVLRQARGNSLLIGLGGSGRSSLTKLATSIRNYNLFSIEITKNYKDAMWKDDLKKVLKMAGAKSKPGEGVVFLFSDTQIVKESFLEDLNNILNTGEVPNLMGPEDFEEIMTDIRNMKKDVPKINTDTRDNILKFFVQNTRDNLHIVLTFSPAGDKLRTRCREFSSIINCCTIDWFDKWPNDALRSVALREYKLNENLGISEFQEKLADLSVIIHNDVKDYCEKFFDQLKRKNYTTPTSYLELLKCYISSMQHQQNHLPLKIRKYSVGLQTLHETNIEVGALQEKIKEMQPKLDQKAKENTVLLAELEIKGGEAAKTEEVVSKETADAQVIKDQVSEQKQSCEADLAEAKPALEIANKAVQNINSGDISEMKNMGKPPLMVQTVMCSICLLLGKKESWDDAKKLLSEMNFKDQLKNYGQTIHLVPEKTFLKFRKIYLTNEEFNFTRIEQVSKSCASLFTWATATDKFQRVKKEVGPKEKALEAALIQLKDVEGKLAIKQKVLKETQEIVAQLNQQFETSQRESESLIQQQKLATVQLARAEKLLSGLANESVRWKINVGELNEDLKNLVGNILLSAAFISYLGPFTAEYRQELSDLWKNKCINEMQIPTSSNFDLTRIMSDDVQLRDWQDHGLPSDRLSSENGILIFNCRRWPLIIDPQNQANKWLRKLWKDSNLQITKLSEPNFLKILENCIRFGQPCLIENVEEELDPSIEPVLQKQVIKKGAQLLLRLGDTDVPYNPDFKLYITTKMPNPHYLPEVSIKVTLINFTVTPSGLEDQLLVEVVRYERIELEEKRISLILQISQDKKQLQDLENKILKQIGEAQGRILDDEELITTLDASKITANTVEQRMAQAKVTQLEIDTARESYRSVAKRGSILFFSIAGLASINSMYQYSLEFFIKLFIRRLDQSEKPPELQDRLDVLLTDMTSSIYRNICRGLFEVDKLLFSFIITCKIALKQANIGDREWAYFTNGPQGTLKEDIEQPPFLNEKTWKSIIGLAKTIPQFKDLTYYINENKNNVWSRIYNEEDPYAITLPEELDDISDFQKLLMYYAIRPAQLILGIQQFVGKQLGMEFTESPVFDLKGSYEDSDCTQPLIFVLSPGADPIQYLLGLAKNKEMTDRLNIMSLGQGQGPIAEERIIAGRRNGDWVCLQNCHLSVSWLPKLERIQEGMVASEVHEDFRLWLTSNPSDAFPVSILQSGIKITNEPPKGLKANLKGTYNEFKEEEYESCTKPDEFRKLLFSLAFFHAIILERKKFGAIGWNTGYKWMNSDFQTCNLQLRIYLEEQDFVPYDCLKYIFAEVNYGGRVTDNKDTRLINALLARYFNPDVLETKSYKFSESDAYKSPDDLSLQSVKEFINNLPLKDEPEIFGLHQNSNIVYQQNVANKFMDTLMDVFQSGSGGGGAGFTPDQIVAAIAVDLEKKLKDCKTFTYTQSANPNSLEIFRNQELDRFNIVIKVMKSSLVELQKAIKGLVVMSMNLELMYNAFLLKKVPVLWSSKAYPSLKPLLAWVDDFIQRLVFFNEWIANDKQDSYWVSALFFPQGFMTAAKQMHSRNFQIPIDTLVFETHVQDYYAEDIKGKYKEVGVNVHGLFMQGSKWDDQKFSIVESEKKQLFTPMPVIWLKPLVLDEYNPVSCYQAPLYKTSLRFGELNTTGESTNFVLFIDLKSNVDINHWVRRGVALLCQLDD